MSKLFGTDGIRGLANQHPMTSEVAIAVGRAVAATLKQEHARFNRPSRKGVRPRVVVGKDTRLSGYMIETALTSGICSMGVDVILIGPMPTPGVAFVTQSMRADAGVMISASHNPFQDNGIKIFSADGFKLPDGLEAQIEHWVAHPNELPRATGADLGRAKRIDDVLGRYLVFLKSLFPKDLDLQGMKIALDCANGASYKVAPLVFEELGAEVLKLGVSPNGLNINDDCGALFPRNMSQAVLRMGADLGISLDGDGDRCILSDEKGEIVDGDQIIGLCAIELAKEGKLPGNTVVTTPMSNVGLELSLKRHGIEMVRAAVGDRYVVEQLRKNQWTLGGEQSGHIIFLEHSTTGDGILAALKVLEAMRRTEKPLSELKREISLFPQSRVDIAISKRTPLDSIPEVVRAIETSEAALKNRGRVFVRLSGTEPLARVLIEGENRAEIDQHAKAIASVIEKHLG